MVNNIFRRFSGSLATVSLNGAHLMCVHDYNHVNKPATYIVREGLVYSYTACFIFGGKFYVTYRLSDLSFSKLVSFVQKSNRPTLIEFCND